MKNILVVDDEADLLELTCMLIESFGYHVFSANSGELALDLFKDKDIDLVLTDFNMPGMNGVEMISSFHKLDRIIPPSVIISAYKDKILSEEEKERLNIVSLMEKPFFENQLKELLLNIFK